MSTTGALLARQLIEHVRDQAVVDWDLLTRDPLEALKVDSSIQVTWVRADSLPAGCSIAATYDRSTNPACISVAEDASVGRRRFSLLHEYGHHLRNQVLAVMEALFSTRGLAAGLEEKMCDAFASFVLIPETSRTQAFAAGVTAAAVAELMIRSSASEQAVAVAAAESMREPGYVMLLNSLGEVEFAARSGDVFPVRRATPQSGLLARAATGIAVRGVAAVDQGAGVMSPELNVDSAVALGRTVAVAVDGAAPWQQFSGGRSVYATPLDGWCADCSHGFTTFTACTLCGEPKCPDCGGCGCQAKEVAGERTCVGCWTVQPPAAFDSPGAERCRDCS